MGDPGIEPGFLRCQRPQRSVLTTILVAPQLYVQVVDIIIHVGCECQNVRFALALGPVSTGGKPNRGGAYESTPEPPHLK